MRRTLRLSDWQAYGHRPGKVEDKKEQWKLWTETPGAFIIGGSLRLKECTVTKETGKMDWCFKFNMTLSKLSPDFTLAFNKEGGTCLPVKLTGGKIVAQSGSYKQTGRFDDTSDIRLQVYGDLPSHRFFVTINGQSSMECPIDTALVGQKIDCLMLSSRQGETWVDDILLFNFGRAILKQETLDPGGEVWINGTSVAVINNRHPYNLDVTGYLKPDSENVIAVLVKPYKAVHPMFHVPSNRYIGWQLGRAELILTARAVRYRPTG
ncbi:hypothetical protein M1B79_05355 [Bacteroides sp. KH365_2]|uniref:Uncharacterized protein n=1 Tax=Bacteroides muris (ex Fokt et al. 2023) TaxID=2937417 RepID=A0A9X2SRU6_9BACE|nr:hypothetical protein [Bacteroides muris (ex Fokt et al. 2023)]